MNIYGFWQVVSEIYCSLHTIQVTCLSRLMLQFISDVMIGEIIRHIRNLRRTSCARLSNIREIRHVCMLGSDCYILRKVRKARVGYWGFALKLG